MHDEIYCALRTPFYPSEYSGSLISFLFVSVMVKIVREGGRKKSYLDIN